LIDFIGPLLLHSSPRGASENGLTDCPRLSRDEEAFANVASRAGGSAGGIIYNLCVLPPVQFEFTYYVIDNYEKTYERIGAQALLCFPHALA
jgi:hypothetical protein